MSAMNQLMILHAAMGVINMAPSMPDLIGETDCEQCSFRRMNTDGGHCYMFKEKVENCAQFDKLKQKKDGVVKPT